MTVYFAVRMARVRLKAEVAEEFLEIRLHPLDCRPDGVAGQHG